MARALRITLIVLAVVVLLLAGGIFTATRLIDPNAFKPRLVELAREHAGLRLAIPGELDWNFWPSLSLSVGRVETRLPDQQRLFAAVDQARVGVAVWPLLFGEVRMDALRVDGINVNLVRTAEGANWEQIGPRQSADQATSPAPGPKPKPEGGALTVPISIPEVAITNARVHYRDTAEGTDILMRHINLTAREVTLGEAFPLTLSLRYQDQTDIRVDLELDARTSLEPGNGHYRLAPMTVTADVAGLTARPARVRLEQSLDVRLDRERARVEDFTLRAAGTRTRGNLEVRNWSAEPEFSGRVETEPFDANAALKALSISPIETRNPKALSKVALSTGIGGEPGSLMAENLEITVDETTITGRAGLADLDNARIVADLKLDTLELDGYRPPEAKQPETKGQPASAQDGGTRPRPLSTDPLLPLETIRGLNAEAKLHIGRAGYRDLAVTNADFAVTANNGVINITRATGKALDGSFDLAARLDASGDQPRLEARQKLTRMRIQPLVKTVLGKDLFKGVLSMETELAATGNTEKALMDSATGTAELTLQDGTLRGVNFHRMLLEGLDKILGRHQGLTAYLPSRATGELPETLSKDTRIVDLSAKTHLDDRVAYLDRMKAELRKGTLTGTGWFNLYNQDFDFNLGLRSPELGDSEYLAGRSWPIRCAGNVAGNPTDWCRPHREGFRAIGREIAADAAKQRIQEKLGVEASGDSAEQVIKNAAEKKIRDKAEDKLRKELRELFQ